ncbi:MAG: hypothetical protein KKE73_07680 [Proteobacteria bacterium]|nr:hypothetical protein [Pseudomonadota bacterium]
MDRGEVWVPVNLRGFRINFEMNSAGSVRRREDDGQGRFLVPEAGPRGSWGYHLGCDGRETWLAAAEIFKAFGIEGDPAVAWQDQARRCAAAQNRLLEQRARLSDPLGTMLQEAEGETLLALLNTLSRGCPWERSRIGGDARGADPVLGF